MRVQVDRGEGRDLRIITFLEDLPCRFCQVSRTAQAGSRTGHSDVFVFPESRAYIGGKLTAIAIAVFAWTTIIGMYYTCEKSVNYAFGDTERNRRMMPIYMVYYMLPCVIFYNIEADALWAFTDILSALYVLITVFIIVAKRKEIFRLFDDFWKRYLPEKEAGKNPPYVTFDCGSQNDEE